MENRRSKDDFDAGQTRRVEVYRLSEDGKWEDHGTGHVTVDYLERSEDLGLFVIDEEDNETLLVHRITVDDIYRKQEDTVISWKDPQYSTELALSFQEISGCTYLWDQICKVQRSLYFGSRNRDIYRSVNSELWELPAVELSTLPLILKIVVESSITDQMRMTELILHDQDFFRKLMDLFRICEDLENLDNLFMIYKIVKGIIMLNDPHIFERIFGEELVMDIIGCLEYDPEVSHVRHRDFLKEHVIFKEAIPIKDPTVLSKIHQTYRISYVKDVVLPRVLDDATTASLNSMVHANNGVVVSLLKEDGTFIQELFSRLTSSSISWESKKNLVYFLHEFCTLSKSLQVVQQLRLFRDLVGLGLFDIISDILHNEDKRLVLTGTDILLLFLNQDPNLLRSYVVRPEGASLLGLLVQGMLTDFGDDMNCQFLEILRTLLDSYASSGSQKDTIIEIFYESHMGELIDVITSSCSGENILAKSDGETSVKHGNTKPEILLNVCELLSFCVLHHPYRIKCYFLHSNSMEKILYLTRRREKYLVVAAVRFLRTVVSRNDDTLIDYIIKHNLLRPIVDAFTANGDRYNLLNSAVLELFEYIVKENLKSLIKYLMKTSWSQLGKFDYLASIKSLQVRYEQSLESIETKPAAVDLDSRKRVEERALEKEEEDYFNEDSDEEDTTSASLPQAQMEQAESTPLNGTVPSSPTVSSKTGGLVEYKDDDEEYKPPPRRPTDASDEDEMTLESLTMKRKMAPKEGHGLAKKPRIGGGGGSKPKDGVFASLCSTLSQAVLPNKKVASVMHSASHPSNAKSDTNKEEKEAEVVGSSTPEEENGRDGNVASRDCSDSLLETRENGRLDSKDHPHIPSNSSPEMAINGL